MRVMPGEPGDRPGASLYELRVSGAIVEQTQRALCPLEAQTREGCTVLTGRLIDQAALYGALDTVAALGLELLEVRRVRT